MKTLGHGICTYTAAFCHWKVRIHLFFVHSLKKNNRNKLSSIVLLSGCSKLSGFALFSARIKWQRATVYPNSNVLHPTTISLPFTSLPFIANWMLLLTQSWSSLGHSYVEHTVHATKTTPRPTLREGDTMNGEDDEVETSSEGVWSSKCFFCCCWSATASTVARRSLRRCSLARSRSNICADSSTAAAAIDWEEDEVAQRTLDVDANSCAASWRADSWAARKRANNSATFFLFINIYWHNQSPCVWYRFIFRFRFTWWDL